MEFWSVEVKSGQPLKVSPGDGKALHLSQVCLGELKKDKGNESVCLFVNVDGNKLVLATLFTAKLPQQQFDLMFERDFELSHNWKNGSVYFYGYKANSPFNRFPFVATDELHGDEFDDSESEEDIPLTAVNDVKSAVEAKPVKPAETSKLNSVKGKESVSGKQKVKIVEPNKDDTDEDDASSDDSMAEDEDDSASEDEDDSDDESGESDEETPQNLDIPYKKRASASKTPVQVKKAKVTPQKSDGKKANVHVATPYPTKKSGKTPADKPNQQSPQLGGSVVCSTCSRTFNSEKGLESHSKAKHGSK